MDNSGRRGRMIGHSQLYLRFGFPQNWASRLTRVPEALKMTNLERTEPDIALFLVPADYATKDQ